MVLSVRIAFVPLLCNIKSLTSFKISSLAIDFARFLEKIPQSDRLLCRIKVEQNVRLFTYTLLILLCSLIFGQTESVEWLVEIEKAKEVPKPIGKDTSLLFYYCLLLVL